MDQSLQEAWYQVIVSIGKIMMNSFPAVIFSAGELHFDSQIRDGLKRNLGFKTKKGKWIQAVSILTHDRLQVFKRNLDVLTV